MLCCALVASDWITIKIKLSQTIQIPEMLNVGTWGPKIQVCQIFMRKYEWNGLTIKILYSAKEIDTNSILIKQLVSLEFNFNLWSSIWILKTGYERVLSGFLT